MSGRGKLDVGTLAIVNIRRDGGTQIRAGLDEATVQEYTDLIKAGAKFPPVGVYQEGPAEKGTPFWLWDGFHRLEAYSRAGVERVQVQFRMGTRRDAIRAACGANADHGLKRSNADKRRAVETFLTDPEWQQWSDGAIAKEANVSRQTVSNIRGELAILPVEGQRLKGLDGRERARPAKDSASGQPTSGTLSPENPKAEDEKGAGVPASPDSAGRVPAAPAPDESRDRLVNVERMLRDAQAEIAPLLARGEAMGIQVSLFRALSTVRAELDARGSRKSSEGLAPVRESEADPSPEDAGITRPAVAPQGDGAQPGDTSDSPANPPHARRAPKAAPMGQTRTVEMNADGSFKRDADGKVAIVPQRSGWPEPKAPPRRGVRVVLETPAGDVAFEDISQVTGDAG